MKTAILSLALAALSMSVQAETTSQKVSDSQATYKWKAGIETGVTYSVLDTDLTGLSSTNYMVRSGFTVGIAGEYNIVDNLAVGLGVKFIQRNYYYENTGTNPWEARYNNNFLNIPLTVGYYLFHNPYREKGFWVKPQVGIYYEYFTSMHTDGTYPQNIMMDFYGNIPTIDYCSTYDFKANENHLRRSLFGGEVGIQAGYSFGRIDAFMGYKYQYGFSHIYKKKSRTSDTARRNSTLFTVGAAYKF